MNVIEVLLVEPISLCHQQSSCSCQNTPWKRCRKPRLYFYGVQHFVFCQSYHGWIDAHCCLPNPSIVLILTPHGGWKQIIELSFVLSWWTPLFDKLVARVCTSLNGIEMGLFLSCDLPCQLHQSFPSFLWSTVEYSFVFVQAWSFEICDVVSLCCESRYKKL